MRTLTTGLLAGLIIASTAINCLADFRLESQNKISEEAVTPRINIYTRKPLTARLTVTSFMTVNEQYAQGYTGIAFAPDECIELEASFGLEQADTPVRIEASLFMIRGSFSLVAIGEHGGSGFWGHITATWQALPQVGVGAMWQRFDGYGPRIDITIPGTPFSVWGAYV